MDRRTCLHVVISIGLSTQTDHHCAWATQNARDYRNIQPVYSIAEEIYDGQTLPRIIQPTIKYFEWARHHHQKEERRKRIEQASALYRHGGFIRSARRRASAFEENIKSASERYNVRYDDLYSLLLLESAFKIDARSPRGAVGIAQLLKATAQEAGLRVDESIDERKNPFKAIAAAARIVAQHRDFFVQEYNVDTNTSMENALAAYHCGRNRLVSLLRREREISYWYLRGNSAANRQYVPRVLAIRKMVFGI